MRIALALVVSLVAVNAHATPMTPKELESSIKAVATSVTLCELTNEQQTKAKVAGTMALMELVKLTGENPMSISDRLGEQIVPEVLKIKSDANEKLKFCNKVRRDL